MGQTILVVEDSRFVDDGVADALVRRGYEWRQAHDGGQAIRLFEECAPDAVVLDLNSPELHRFEGLRHIKDGRSRAVVVVLTGQGSEQTARRALKFGADDFFTKPFREDSLVDAL